MHSNNNRKNCIDSIQCATLVLMAFVSFVCELVTMHFFFTQPHWTNTVKDTFMLLRLGGGVKVKEKLFF